MRFLLPSRGSMPGFGTFYHPRCRRTRRHPLPSSSKTPIVSVAPIPASGLCQVRAKGFWAGRQVLISHQRLIRTRLRSAAEFATQASFGEVKGTMRGNDKD